MFHIELILYSRREMAENVRQYFSYPTTLTTKQYTRHKVVLQFKCLLKQIYHTQNKTRGEYDNFLQPCKLKSRHYNKHIIR